MSAAERTKRTRVPAGRRRQFGAGVVLLLAAVLVGALLAALPATDGREAGAACAPRKVASWAPDQGTTGEFTRYGDDASRADDWSGGDGTHSVRLPDGRVLWLFSDTFLGRVHAPPNRSGQPHSWRDGSAPFVRNSAVVMDRSGRLERTLPAPVFADPAAGQWRWPVAAKVEPRSPGSAEQVVRVLLWTRATGTGPWIYGLPLATEVATLSLPGLRLEGVVRVSDQSTVQDPAERVLYGTTAVDGEEYTYVFGGNDGKTATGAASQAFLARVPRGRLAEPGAWRYWDGEGWGDRAAPVLGDGAKKGVGSAYTVVRDEGTWVLFTMAAGVEGLSTITSYWSCAPSGPWHGPAKGFTPPLPADSAPQQRTAVYNPQAHPALRGDDGRLLLSYDVNWLDPDPRAAQANVSRNVSLYRPRFLRLRLAPGD
ncbi:DUF4185 domain-containing protein [Streptomyces sp. B-S-A8]|uniref:DUF4185 domain-containing protein n=1 Tax=Streptomyces solicavernae TaxID=3043614 RepID=A0ABT6RLP4_9ACTN|nr:DUF4185 domain-containing protein [Streptomyces sp. B-S-A8]MDI3385347.1 DUF4185 domain-containing protein [Streptomyces sp. B-S-A8]